MAGARRQNLDRGSTRAFRVVNAESGRVIDELRTRDAAIDRAMRELGRVPAGRYQVRCATHPGGTGGSSATWAVPPEVIKMGWRR
jgi:hypothetical protein